ncbi:MAG: translation initiation factor IF-2 [Ruminococcus sp.]|nr:translation initiation factor IF-2 [Ruminococcus sp.]
MTVKEYALDVNLSVAEILKKCTDLGIEVKNGEDFLTDDDVISLDNAINLITEEENFDEVDTINEVVDAIVESTNMTKNINITDKKQKLKKKKDQDSKDYSKLRKEMYKNKDKLMKNSKDNSIILFKDGMTVGDLANELNISGTDIIKKLMTLGLMVSINQAIDFENAEIIALEYHKTLKREETQDVANFEEYEIVDKEEDLSVRPPIVTIMGHVDHGKTTLLDYIRDSHIVDKESGGITQAIGAYQIEADGHKITFIDTPGHAAFTEMRARGASVTDIVIIIVAADDGVMPQTKEAVEHAISAKVPIIVAVNKIDKGDANPERIKTEMAEINITPEEWGGNVPFIEISAKTGLGVDKLLETIIAMSEMAELKANPNRYAIGSVIESRQDKNVGGIASLLILNGTLRLGDPLVVGTTFGKVRTMKNDLGESITMASPGTPIEITGLNENPSAGDKFMAFETEKEAKEIALKRADNAKVSKYKKDVISLDDLFSKINEGQKEINIVLKTDVRGSEEAVKNSLLKIDVAGVKINVIRSGIGTITESDVVLANASNAIIIGFNVSPTNNVKEIAKEYNVDIRLYTIIYKCIEEIELAMKGMLDPEFEEKVLGSAEIRRIFKFSKVGNIAGSYVLDGIVKNNVEARLIRDGVIIYTGKIASIQREKDTVKEVKKGFECGITLDNFSDIKTGDIIECFEMVEVKR